MAPKVVLVSGASGYVGSQVTAAFLDAGYRVRGTVRSLSNNEKIAHLTKMIDEGKQLELVEADLMKPETWDCIKGCNFVAHTASPFVVNVPESEAEAKLYAPAKQGTLNVLQKAQEYGVEKVVLTSSVAAITAGWPRSKEKESHIEKPEEQWSKIESKTCDPYSRSKTMAEKAAWDFVKTQKENGKDVFELTTINPVLVTGPVLSANWCQSADIAKTYIDGSIPMAPDFHLNVVDVRDVAKAHVEALEKDEANGERFVVSASPLSVQGWARAVADEFKPLGYKVPTRRMPYWLGWTLSWFMSKMRIVMKSWGRITTVSSQKSKDILNISYIDPATSVVDMTHSIIRAKFAGVPITKQYKEKYATFFSNQ